MNDEKDFLEDLHRKIYQKGAEVNLRPQGDLKPLNGEEYSHWQPTREKSFFQRNIWFIFFGLFILGALGIFIYFGLTSFSEDKVEFTMKGQEEVPAGDIASWRIFITNNNRVRLNKVKVIIVYPANTTPIDDQFVSELRSEIPLSDLDRGQTLQRLIKARLLGQQGDIKNLNVTLVYQLEGISRQLQKELTFPITITDSPVFFTLNFPSQITSGQIHWNTSYRNNSELDLTNLRIRLAYPEGFTPLSTSPNPTKGSEWGPFALKAGEEGVIEITGSIMGKSGEQKTLSVFAEVLGDDGGVLVIAQKLATASVTLPPLDTQIVLNGSQEGGLAYLGDSLHYDIFYQNNSPQTIFNVFIEAQLVGELLDLKKLKTDGSWQPQEKKVRWDEAALPLLAALPSQAQGKISLDIGVISAFTPKRFSDKNFSVQLTVTISSDTPPIPLSPGDVKKTVDLVTLIGTKVTFARQGTFFDIPFPKIGTLPPQVGQKSGYNVYWRITNTSNDLNSVSAKTILPLWASFTGMKNINFSGSGFSYDDATRTLSWNIERVPATVGFVMPVYEAVFQIEIMPLPEHIGKVIDIIGASEFHAKDTFTQEEVSMTIPPLDTTLDGFFRSSKAFVAP